MNRIVMGALVLGLLMAAGAEAQSRPERRDALQQQVFRRFMEHASGELELEAEQRGSLARLLQQGQVERRAIQQELGRARRDLHQAVEAGHDADAARHLAALEELRAREYRLWEREQAALREVLTPTQHARFLMLQLRFNERVRELQQRRPGMGGRAGHGPPGRRPPGMLP